VRLNKSGGGAFLALFSGPEPVTAATVIFAGISHQFHGI
jgi:hypothetical protein